MKTNTYQEHSTLNTKYYSKIYCIVYYRTLLLSLNKNRPND